MYTVTKVYIVSTAVRARPCLIILLFFFFGLSRDEAVTTRGHFGESDVDNKYNTNNI